MQDQLVMWSAFFPILSFSLLITLIFDFLGVRYFIKGTSQTPSTTRDTKPERETIWGFGIFPGLVSFLLLSLPMLMSTMNGTEKTLSIVVFAILDIIASYSGGKLAMRTIKQKVQVDFELE